MNVEQLEEFIANGETLDIEFKGEEKGQLNDSRLVEAVVCLANRLSTTEGLLLLGVEDDGRVTGAKPRHSGLTDPLRLQALLANRTQPPLSCAVELHTLRGASVTAIIVPPARVPIATSEGVYLKRFLGHRGQPECRPFFFHEMMALQADRGDFDYSRVELQGVGWSDLDPLEFERFRQRVKIGRGEPGLLTLPDEELAGALGATLGPDKNRVTVTGLLLFGRESIIRQAIPSHELAFQEFDGLDVRQNEFFRGPLLRCMEEIESRFRVRNRETEVYLGLQRIGLPDYSERAFREALANAVTHRDYTRIGAVLIQMQQGSLQIQSPGGFPQGVTLQNLLVAPPTPRNRSLADALKRAGIVETTGRGIDTIYWEQLNIGRPAPNYEQTSETCVCVTLLGGEGNLQFVRLLLEKSQAGRPFNLNQLLILNQLWHTRYITTKESASLIQRGEAEARAQLQRLVEHGVVETRGEGRSRSYTLSVRIYAGLGRKEHYERQAPPDTTRNWPLLSKSAEKNGRVTRADVVELCKLSPDQATRWLRSLTEAGQLKRHGTKKATYYTLLDEK